MQRIHLELVTSFERLAELRPAWQSLWARDAAATPFSSPEWLLPWCRHLATGPPRCVLGWRGDALAVLAPTFVYQEGTDRVLGLLGGGVSDYQDVLAEDEAAAAALLAHLLSERGAYDRLDLQALSPDAPLVAVARRAGASLVEQVPCPVLALPRRFDDLRGRASSKLLADLRRQRRRGAEAGRLDVVRSTPDTYRALLDDLLQLHGARWRSRGEDGVLAAPGLDAFHADAARELQEAGVLRVTAVQLDGRSIAVLYGFAARGRHYAYLQGIAPDAANLSPGTLLVAAAVEGAIAEGARELDMLRGDEPYKYRWGAVDRCTYRLTTPPANAHPGRVPTATTV